MILAARRKTHARLEILDDEVFKRQPTANAQLEFERTTIAHDIAASSGAFRVPVISGYDPAEGAISFERERSIVAFGELAPDRDKCDRYLSGIAAALARIHAYTPAPEYAQRAVRLFDSEPGGSANFLHGDFSGQNVFVDVEEDKLVILDWSNAPWLAVGKHIMDCGYYDVAVFVISLYCRRPGEKFRISQPGAVARKFIDSYADQFAGYDDAECRFWLDRVVTRFVSGPRTTIQRARLLACAMSIRNLRKFVADL